MDHRGQLVSMFFLLLWAQRVCPVDKAFLHLPSPMPSLLTRIQSEDTLWIPLAIHVVLPSEDISFPPERIRSQLRALNRDFAQAGIQFYLPKRGPGGLPTCGVTWHFSPLGDHDWTLQEDTLKRFVRWDPDSFLNVWIVYNMPMQVIGYARALGDSTGLAGVVLKAEIVGEGEEVRPPFNRGRTAVHEMGHVFSLLHPFEGGCRGGSPETCAIEGDEICDTPPQHQSHFGCPSPPPNTCWEEPMDLPDPIHNFMGYTDDDCMTHFTPQQIERMRHFLQSYGSVLISETNRQARGWYEPLLPECAVVSTLLNVPFRPSLHRHGHEIRIENVDEIRVYDAMGRLLIIRSGSIVEMIDLPSGLYFIEGYRQSQRWSYKLWWF
ncbi:MAG: M43 family zinc metalloprotease [Bacteroidia bacterium]|nr:M43 family zinc metalloprotease [Bacteroidia bacterium]MDW8015745.1 M43 family zinc metalloprotease [Bacteroidia bacterium]